MYNTEVCNIQPQDFFFPCQMTCGICKALLSFQSTSAFVILFDSCDSPESRESGNNPMILRKREQRHQEVLGLVRVRVETCTEPGLLTLVQVLAPSRRPLLAGWEGRDLQDLWEE